MTTTYDYKFVLDYPLGRWGEYDDDRFRGACGRKPNRHLIVRRQSGNKNPKTFHGPSNYFTTKRAEPVTGRRIISTMPLNVNVNYNFRVPPNPGGGGPR